MDGRLLVVLLVFGHCSFARNRNWHRMGEGFIAELLAFGGFGFGSLFFPIFVFAVNTSMFVALLILESSSLGLLESLFFQKPL